METAHLPNGTALQGGKYKIVRFIGSGGFGCTYEGEHTMLGSKVAIKEFFVKDFCDRDNSTSHITVSTSGKKELVDKLKGKFVEEARATARMQHPNIVKVHDVFEENGAAYYVMDYIEGTSLEKLVKENGPLPEQTALKYIRQVADALGYVHSLNRLHLDLKPGNIMTDGHGNAVLVDFGASKQYDEAGGENTSTLIGKTPGYAPIEQMGNTITTFSPATDIYALGATLYKLLTGITPPGSNLLASGEELPPLPSNISASTANAVSAAMKIARSERLQNVESFLSLLDYEEKMTPSEGDIYTIMDDGTVAKSDPISNGHEYVDLGLSVKWATCNIGAKTPLDCGNFFAWGEISPKQIYKKKGCYTRRKRMGNIAGEPSYDAAKANWGGTWRIPTKNEMKELVKKCKWEWTTQYVNRGFKVTGPNGNSIFLPVAGWMWRSWNRKVGLAGQYWSSMPNNDKNRAFCLRFRRHRILFFLRYRIGIGLRRRNHGHVIRPVTD